MRIIYVRARRVEGCFTARSNVMHICYVTQDGKRVLYVLSQSEARDQMGRGTHIKNIKKNIMEMENGDIEKKLAAVGKFIDVRA